jgi:hypothetical protein
MIQDSLQDPSLYEDFLEVTFNIQYYLLKGARGVVVVKALRYKPAGRGFDSRWCHWNFSVT